MQSRDKNILLVSYYFPPMGMGGVQRAAKTAKYLAQFGWHVTVLTSKGEELPLHDESMMNDLPSDVEVIGVNDPAAIVRKSGSSTDYVIKPGSGFLQRLVRVPDAKTLWSANAADRAMKIVNDKSIKYIITTSPPPSAHKIGLKLKKEINIRWLADFRDPWFADELEPLTPFHSRIRNRLEADILSNADIVTSVTASHFHDLINRFPEYKTKVHYIPNGYDPEDFEVLTESNPSKLIFAHCGTLCSRYGAEAFFEGLEKIVTENKEFSKEIEFWQIGAVNDDIYEMLTEKYSKNIEIKFFGYMNHDKALQKLAQSSVVVVFGGVTRDSTKIIPAKLYEGLALAKPLAAAVPRDSAVYNVIREMPGVYHLDTDDGTSLNKSLRDVISAHKSGRPFHESRESQIQKFSRKVQANQIAGLLKGA